MSTWSQRRFGSDGMGGQPFEQQVCDRVGLLVEHPMRAVKCLEAVFAGDVAAGVAGAFLRKPASPSLHTYIVGTAVLAWIDGAYPSVESRGTN